MNAPQQFELQVFDGKEYRTTATGERRSLEPAFEAMPRAIRRLVLPGKHPARPKYTKPRGMQGPGRSRMSIMGDYMAWVEKKGLTRVHVYASPGHPTSDGGIEFVQVDPADFLGPAPEAETEE